MVIFHSYVSLPEGKCRNMTYNDSLTCKKVIWEIHRVVSGCMTYFLLLLPPIWSIWVYRKMLWYTQKLQGLTREMMIKHLKFGDSGIHRYPISRQSKFPNYHLWIGSGHPSFDMGTLHSERWDAFGQLAEPTSVRRIIHVDHRQGAKGQPVEYWYFT